MGLVTRLSGDLHQSASQYRNGDWASVAPAGRVVSSPFCPLMFAMFRIEVISSTTN
jgi:hypothetical protein